MSDHWLVPPLARCHIVSRRSTPHLATLFEGFTAYLTVGRQCRHGTITTASFCDFLSYAESNPLTPLAVSPEAGQAAQPAPDAAVSEPLFPVTDRKSTRLNSSHLVISYAVFCLKK